MNNSACCSRLGADQCPCTVIEDRLDRSADTRGVDQFEACSRSFGPPDLSRSYRPGSRTFQSWMFTIARNELRDYWRTTQRTLPMLDMDITDQDEPADIDPREAQAAVRRAMASLTDDQRQVVVLRYFGNKSHEEIAAIMGKREGAVRALLMRALRQMRKVMGDAAP